MPEPRGWSNVSAPALHLGTGGYTSQHQRHFVPFGSNVPEAYQSSVAGQQAPHSTFLEQATSSVPSTPFIGSGCGEESPFSSFGNTPIMRTPSWPNHSVGFGLAGVPAPGQFDPTAWDLDDFLPYLSPSPSTQLFPMTSLDAETPSYPYPQALGSTSASAIEDGLGIRGSGQESAFIPHAWQPRPIQRYTANEHAHFPEVSAVHPTFPGALNHRSNRSGAPDVHIAPRRPRYVGPRRIAPMPPFELGCVGTVQKKESHTEAMGTEAESAQTRSADAVFPCPMFPCPIAHCNKMFARIEQAKRHAHTARQQIDKAWDFPCTVAGCVKKFRLKHKRKEHITKVHGAD